MNGVIRVGELLFRNRDWTSVPLALWMIRNARPRSNRFLAGLALAGVGLLLRFWSVAHIGRTSRTRAVNPPALRIVSGPYRVFKHPLYVGNGILSEGLAIASGAGRGWLPIVFPIAWIAQYFPIMQWETWLLNRVNPPRTVVQPDWNEALKSERRTWQAVGAFLLLTFAFGWRNARAAARSA